MSPAKQINMLTLALTCVHERPNIYNSYTNNIHTYICIAYACLCILNTCIHSHTAQWLLVRHFDIKFRFSSIYTVLLHLLLPWCHQNETVVYVFKYMVVINFSQIGISNQFRGNVSHSTPFTIPNSLHRLGLSILREIGP